MHKVNGTLRLSASEIIEAIKRRGDCKFFHELSRDENGATWQAKRGDEPTRTLTYTMQDARADGRVKPCSMWERYPGQMYSVTAMRKLAAEVWPEVEQ